MGILGNLINKVGTAIGKSKYGEQIGKTLDIITKPAQIVGVAVSQPKTLITQGYSAAKKQTLNEPIEKSIGKVALNTGVVGAAVLTGGTSVGRTALTSVGKSLIPKTTSGKIIAAAAAPAVVTAVASNPKILTEAAKIPLKSAEFGADVGKATKEPTKENILNIAKENPLITGLVVSAGALTLGKTLLPAAGAVTNIQTKESVQDLTEQLRNLPPAAVSAPVATDSKTLATTQIPFTPTTAVTAATAPLPTTSGTRKISKRKARKQIPTSINQKVNVVVQNKSSSVGIKQSKNYLKRSILA